MLSKYFFEYDREYVITRGEKDDYSEDNIITVQVIKETVKALKVLLNVKDIRIFVRGTIGNQNCNTESEVLSVGNSTITIKDYDKNDKLVDTKISINKTETISYPAFDRNTFNFIKDANGHYVFETVIYHNDYINKLTIKYELQKDS